MLIQRASWAYLRSALGIDDVAWKQVQAELAQTADSIGRIDNKVNAAMATTSTAAPCRTPLT